MKKLLLILFCTVTLFSSTQSQTNTEMMEQFQKEMEKFLQGFNLQDGGIMMDTMLIQPFGFYDGFSEGDGNVPQGMEKQMQEMMNFLMKQLGQMDDSQTPFKWDELFQQMDPDFALPAPENPSEKSPEKTPQKKKRKTYTL